MDFGTIIFLYFIIIHPICGGLAAAVGDSRNAKMECATLGLIFGPLGLIASLGFDRRLLCPNCGTIWNGHPKLCPGCKKQITWDLNSPIPKAIIYEDQPPPNTR